jgi:hypothetical protein
MAALLFVAVVITGWISWRVDRSCFQDVMLGAEYTAERLTDGHWRHTWSFR